MNDPLVLGIDGGGTKTRAVAMAACGDVAVLSSALSGPSNIAAVGAESAAAAVIEAARAAFPDGCSTGDVVSICAGVAGFAHEPNRRRFTDLVRKAFPAAKIDVQPDYVTAFDGALAGKPGIVVIAGTGQVAYGENEAGSSARAGGYGYLIDDSGSGYGIGRNAIAAVLRAADRTGPNTLLIEMLAAELSLTGTSELVPGVYGGEIDRVRIASLAAVVSSAADRGDGAASQIMRDAGSALAGLALSVRALLWTDADPVSISTAGSLWGSEILSSRFREALRDSAPTLRVIDPTYDGAVGAALRARRLLDTEGGGAVN